MSIDESGVTAKDTQSDNSLEDEACLQNMSPRPQRLHTWFNLIPVDEYETNRPERVLFLDTFVTIRPDFGDSGTSYTVLFEGKQTMTTVTYIGVIFVWYGEDLSRPDRPFPELYQELYPSKYTTSKPVIFENTHIMDFVENGSDNLHFRVVHSWEYSKIYNHRISEGTITLEQDTRFRYGSCSFNPFIRMLSKIIPELELTHDYVYHGPGLAVVGARGRGSPEFHALVSLTPEGENRTRVYVTMAIAPDTFPAWMEKSFQTFFPRHKLRDLLAGVMANYIQNEFDVDAVIWENRKVMQNPNLLPSEKHLQNVMNWGKTFYPKGFVAPQAKQTKPEEEKKWVYLDEARKMPKGKIKSYNVVGEALIGYRDSRGNIHVRDAYCPHQGAHLGIRGTLVDDCVRCPFHGFHFDTEGNCRGPNVNNITRLLPGLDLTLIEHRVTDGQIEVLV